MKIISIKDHTYEASDIMIKNVLDAAKETMDKKSEHNIYAIEKENIIIMKKEIFNNKKEKDKKVKEYKKIGFKVYC